MDAWSGVNVSSLQEVGQVSAVIASVTDKKGELSVDSQVSHCCFGRTVVVFRRIPLLTLSLPSSKSKFSQPFKERCVGVLVRIGSTNHLSSE